MAREHARIWLDINADDDFEALPFDAQGFYCRVVLTLDDLSYCGVADWRPKRLTTKAPDLTLPRILAAAHALEEGRQCLFDLDTEEILARSFIRRDQLIRNPKMAAAVVKAYGGIASKTLRAAVVTEIRRVHDEHPEYSAWKHPDVGEALAKIMAKPGLDEVTYTPQITNPITNGHSVPITNRITNTDPVPITNTQSVPNGEPIGYGDSVPIPSTYTSTSTPAPSEGYVSREPHQGDATPATTPPRPPDRCARHANVDNPPACRPCAESRTTAEAWDRDHREARARAAVTRRREILACPDCDDNGWTGDPDEGLIRCPNHTWETTDA